MPITVVSGPTPVLGPGVGIIVHTDVIGPIGVDWTWQLHIRRSGEEQQAVLITAPIWTTDTRERRIWVDGDPDGGQTTQYGRYVSLNTNDQVNVEMQLVDADGSTIHDQGTITGVRWDTSTSSSRLVDTGAGGLTDEQAAQLQRTDLATQTMDANWQQYVTVTLPSLSTVLNTITGGITATLGTGAQAAQHFIGELLSWATPDINTDFDMSGGVTCDPVRYDASFQNVQAVGVFIDNYPDHYRFVTPDGNWSFRDLAVLSFYRAGTLLERHGIHTLVFSVGPLPGSISPWPVNITFGVQPGDYHIHVDWAAGVCGHVVGSALP